MKRLLALAVALLLPVSAWAQTTGGGSLRGSGTAGQLPFFSNSNTVAGDTQLTWDNTLKTLVVGTGSTSVTMATATLTANRTFTLPDANSVAVVPSTCAGGTVASGVSAGGVISCVISAGGTAGATRQVLYNDGGSQAGDASFLWDKTAKTLNVAGTGVPTASLHLGTNGLTGHLRMDGIAGDPEAPTAGDHWYTTVHKSHRLQSTIGTLGLAGLLANQVVILTGDTIASTAVETNFTSTMLAPANSLTVGKLVRIRARGTHGTTGTPTLIFKVRAGATNLCTSAAITTGSGVAGKMWRVECDLVVTAIGASGAIEAQGLAQVATSTTATTTAEMVNAATITVDTTTSLSLQVTATWSASSSSNTITMRQFTVEVLD
jgi:hypothetical protein